MQQSLFFLIPLFVLITGLCLETFFIISDWKKKLKTAALFKGLASLCFVAMGGYLLTKNPSPQGWFIFLGLICGMFGDIWLAVKKTLSGIWAEVINATGILSFMTGHLLYTMALFYAGILDFKLYMILLGILCLLIIPFLFYKARKSPVLHRITGSIYLLAVISMFCTSAGLFAMQKSLFSAIFLTGALLFLISDIITIYNSLLEAKPKKLRAVNLAVYYAAQLLIAFSIFLF